MWKRECGREKVSVGESECGRESEWERVSVGMRERVSEGEECGRESECGKECGRE